MPRAASGRSSLAWGGGWVASEVATTSQGVLAAPQACSARLPKWPRARKRLRAQKPRPLRDPLPALLAILALPFQARRLPTLPQVRRRLCWTLLPYFAFFSRREHRCLPLGCCSRPGGDGSPMFTVHVYPLITLRVGLGRPSWVLSPRPVAVPTCPSYRRTAPHLGGSSAREVACQAGRSHLGAARYCCA